MNRRHHHHHLHRRHDAGGGHSHDAPKLINDALASDQRGLHALKLSFAVLFVTAVVQVVIVVHTGSVALLADTIHNFSGALTAIPLFIAFRLGRRPANRRYTYGTAAPRISPGCSWWP